MASATIDAFISGEPVTGPGARRGAPAPPAPAAEAAAEISMPLLVGVGLLLAYLAWKKFK